MRLDVVLNSEASAGIVSSVEVVVVVVDVVLAVSVVDLVLADAASDCIGTIRNRCRPRNGRSWPYLLVVVVDGATLVPATDVGGSSVVSVGSMGDTSALSTGVAVADAVAIDWNELDTGTNGLRRASSDNMLRTCSMTSR